MKAQDVAEVIIFAFELERIADGIHANHREDANNKTKKKEELSLWFLMSDDGRHILQLFGYHLANKMKQRTFYQMGKSLSQVLLVYEDFAKYCHTVWPEMNKFDSVLPVLFRIIKNRHGVVSLREMDYFLEICRKQISPFVADIKQTVPPHQLRLFMQALSQQCEKQDLNNTGFIQKILLQELYKKILKRSPPQWPKALYNVNNINEISYKQLLGPQYLTAGKAISDYIISKFISKVVKAIKKAGAILKKKGDKRSKKSKTGRVIRPTEKNKNEKLLHKYIEANKPKKAQEGSRNQFMVKGLILDIIGTVVDMKYRDGLTDQTGQGKVIKSVYITQPQFPEMEFDNPSIKINKIKFVGNNGLGLYVWNNKGYLIDNAKSLKKSQFVLNLSSIFKSSPVIEYEVVDDKIYLLKENGLLYSWSIDGDTFLHQIQTSFLKPMSPPDSDFNSFMQIKEGLVVINCTHQPNSRFQLYSLDLAYIASIELNPAQFDLTYKYCQQSRFILKNLNKFALDKKVDSVSDFKQLVGLTTDASLEFVNMICRAYQEKPLHVGRILQFAKWVINFMNFNEIGFPLTIHDKLQRKNYDSQVVSYLLKLGYISEGTAQQIEAFKVKNYLKLIDFRKLNLLSLFEDNMLEPIKSPFINKKGFLSWVAPACLMDLEVKQLVESLAFRPDGRVDMSKLYYNEHYRRLVDSRYNRFVPERYKYLQIPPICVKQYIPVPSSQAVVLSLSFPIRPVLYVNSLVSGDLLHLYNLQTQTSIPPRMKICDKNGFIFVTANRSIALWSSTFLVSTKSFEPNISWPWLQSSEIIDILIIYQLSTLITLTKDCIKIWDFDELFKQKETRHTFQIKPGYKAMEKPGGSNNQLRLYKKKILLRQTASSLFYTVTPNECVMVGAVSATKSQKFYVKSFLINKFKIAINNKKQHYQIPTRLMRQLQQMALKRKNLPPLNKNRWMNDNQKDTLNRIAQHLKQNIDSVVNLEVNTSLKPQLQQKISFLAHELSNIYSRNMFKNNEESRRLENIFKLITLKNIKDVNEILQHKFLELYKLPNQLGFSLSRMLEDSLSTKQKKAINRSLYVLSLIEKYSRSMVQAGHKLSKLISQDRRTIDQKSILSLLPTKLPLDSRIIAKSVKLLNSLQNPVELVVNIINSYLPTRYRFLVPRYIKQIISCRQSPELNEYISNRYENEPTLTQIHARLTNQQWSSGIQEYLRTKELLKFAHEQVISIFPLAATCNYSLIQALMCLKVISEDEAFYYCVKQSLNPQERLSSKINVSNQGNGEDIDEISQKIEKKVRQNNIQLTYPKISHSFFKQRLYDGQNCDYYFFGFLKGDRSDLQIQTDNLQLCFANVRRKLRLQYNLPQWQYIMGQKIKIVKPFISKLLQRFPVDFRIVTANDLRTGLMNYIDQEKIYEDIAKRAGYASTSSTEKLNLWKKNNGEGVESQGMYIDMNQFFRFAEDYNPLLLELEKSAPDQGKKEIKIPMWAFLSRLVGDFHLLSITKFRQLLTLSLRPLSIRSAQEIIQKYFKQMKQISLFDIQDIMTQDYSFIGRYLIDKYHRLDYQHRFTIISGKVSSTQVSQLLTSKAITNYLFGDALRGLNELLPFEQINNAIKTHLVEPAAKTMTEAFLSTLSLKYSQLIEYQLKKTAIMPALALTQLLHHKESEIPVVICLLKYMTGEPNSAQIINLNAVLNCMKLNEQSKGRQRYIDYLQSLVLQTKGKNLVNLFLDQCQPQNLPFTEEDQPKQYTFTQEHMEDVLGGKHLWYVNFKPFATARQFIDHARFKQRQSQQLFSSIAFFTQNCVCRVGINEIMHVIGENVQFPDFYYKLKSSFKTLSKMSTESLLLIYEAIIGISQNKKCDANGMRALCQQHIPTHKKMEWICALYDRQFLSDPLQHEQQVLEYELKIERLKNLYDSHNQSTRETQKQAVKQSLHYHKYLVYKYLSNDVTKIKQLTSCMREKNDNEARKLLQIYGVIDPIHIIQLMKYFALENVHTQQKKYVGSDDSPIEQIKKIIEIIKQHKNLLNFAINAEQFKQNPTIYDSIVRIQQSKVYEQFLSLGSGQYFSSFHALLAYCQSSLLSKLTSNQQILRVQTQVRDFLIKRDLAPAKLYEMFDLSTYDNIVRYLPEVALIGSENDEQVANLTKIVSEMAKPQRLNLKYPINSNDFEILLSQLSAESQNYRKQYQHIYTELDMFGVGYVNLNDIPKYRGTIPTYLTPYVYIPSYIDYITEQDKAKRGSLPSKYVGPILEPPQDKQLRMKVKQKLLKYQVPVHKSQKTKFIKVDICLAIMGEFGIAQNHQYHEFIKQKFTMQSCGLLDLSGIIDWLTNSLLDQKKQNTQTQAAEQKASKSDNLIQEIDNGGGLYAYLETKKNHSDELQKLYQLLIQLSSNKNKVQTQLLASISSKSNQKMQAAIIILKQLAEDYFKQIKKWDTFNNHFCREIKNMAQVYYGLVFKFYQTHIRVDMHQIYNDASQKGELTLLTLWRYIEQKGITGYSRADVNQLFSAIDINSDKRLSYLEFCQFWMACQQVFQAEDLDKYSMSAKIDQINIEVKNAFLELCCVQLHNSYNEQIGIDDLVRFTNMPNVEKVDFIARAVNSASISKGPASGALNTRIQMSKSKLKIMMDKMKVSQTTKNELCQNLLIEATQPYIYPYIQQGYNAQSLARIIMLKYPNLGYLILQYFEDLCQMNVQTLGQKYKSLKIVLQTPESVKKSDKMKVMTSLVSNIQQSYRKHPLKVKSYEHKELGGSVAYSLLTEQVVKNLKRVGKQVKQILNYLNKIELPSVALNYQLDILHYNEFDDPKNRLKSLQPSGLNQWSNKIVVEDLNEPLFRIKSFLFSKKPIILNNLDSLKDCVLHRQIEWKDTDFVCKSENKVNLLQHALLYSDPEISLMPLNVETSNRFKVEGAYAFRSEYTPMIQMRPVQCPDSDSLMDQIMSLVKSINDKLVYCYYKYSVTGLLIIPRNILVNVNNNSDLKFDYFVSGLSLNSNAIKNREQTVTYIDGIDSKYLLDLKRPYPPEAELGTLTEAIDVYMLAHIVYAMFRHKLNPSDAEIPQILARSCEQEPLWDWSSPLHQIAASRITQESTKTSQKQQQIWMMFYQCSYHDWFMRPRLHQLQQMIDNYFQGFTFQPNSQIFEASNAIQEFLSCLVDNKLNEAIIKMKLIPTSHWKLNQILKFRQSLQIYTQFDTQVLQYFNLVLESYMKSDLAEQDPDKMRAFLSSVVDYIMMIPVSNSGQCYLTNAAFKGLLNDRKVRRYLNWCDQNWRIEEYEINKKIQKINMHDKLEELHKNSSFYHDISTLAECRVALAEGQAAKRSETSKKVAISFIQSCLVSNNINKVYAVYRSSILRNIYCYLSKQELQANVISIFQIATACFNPTLSINRFRSVDEVYKVIMVISNSIKASKASPAKTASTKLKQTASMTISAQPSSTDNNVDNQSIVSMQDFVNNYYTLSGQQCKEVVLREICRTQLCTLPVLTYLINQVEVNKLDRIIINLNYDKDSARILKSPVVGGYIQKMKQLKMESSLAQIKQAISLHTECLSLCQISTAPIEHSSYPQLLRDHLRYYQWYCQLDHQNMSVNFQKNYYAYFQSFIAKTQKLYQNEIKEVQQDQTSLQIVTLIVKIHRIMFDIWTQLPCHPDFTSATLRFLMNALQAIYSSDSIYLKSKVNSQVGPDILYVLRRFWVEQPSINKHDLIQIAVVNGFVQFYCRMVIKQHELMQNYIDKNVENIHMTDNYYPEAEFRLTCFHLFLHNIRYQTQISQILIANKFPAYIVDTMLNSTLTLDLRFYKANNQVVPFRFCHPLRAQAIALIGFALSFQGSFIANDICSKLITYLPSELKNVDCDDLESLPNRMKWVQSLWLLANITISENERLKYEFVNLRLHQLLTSQISRHSFLARFFPRMTQTLTNTDFFTSSLARSQIK